MNYKDSQVRCCHVETACNRTGMSDLVVHYLTKTVLLNLLGPLVPFENDLVSDSQSHRSQELLSDKP